ncbi:MAG: MFS transporter [Gammaproteobacteria bacterium]|nr:MFS transporter [Gammaproteobacteria bacterium]
MSDRRTIFSWALYDWANSAYSTTVISGFFPVFFKQYWAVGSDPALSTLHLGVANSLGSIVVALSAPVLGAIADQGGLKRRYLAFFAYVGAVTTGALFFVGEGMWFAALFLYVVASVGFSGGNSLYDSLLVDVAEPEQSDRISAFGYGLGYLGGGLLFAVCIWLQSSPGSFGLADSATAIRVSFILVALWWALFTLPVLLWVREARPPGGRSAGAVRAGLRQLSATLRHVRRLRVVVVFLVAYWLYIDGVDTISRMAVDYGLSIGLDAKDLVLALLIAQFVGFPAAIGFGFVGERFGTRRALLAGITVYVGVCVYASGIDSGTEFFVLAGVLGLVQGGVQALSRSLYSRLIPHNKAAEFFGIYNLLGKSAAIFGPLIMGWVGVLTGSPRLSILGVIVLLVAGGLLLLRVDEREGERLAHSLEET